MYVRKNRINPHLLSFHSIKSNCAKRYQRLLIFSPLAVRYFDTRFFNFLFFFEEGTWLFVLYRKIKFPFFCQHTGMMIDIYIHAYNKN